jgi:hypothetical protein
MTDALDSETKENARTYRSTPTSEMVVDNSPPLPNGSISGKIAITAIQLVTLQNLKHMQLMNIFAC